MKTSNKIIAFGLVLACMACGAKKSTQSTLEENQQEMAANDPNMGQDGMSGQEASMGDSDMEDSAMGENSMDNQGMNGSDASDGSGEMEDASTSGDSVMNIDSELAKANKNIDYLDMYSRLDMTSTQIQQFEGALTNFHTQQRSTPNGEMMGSLADERDRQLKEILTEEQYTAYESWKESN